MNKKSKSETLVILRHLLIFACSIILAVGIGALGTLFDKGVGMPKTLLICIFSICTVIVAILIFLNLFLTKKYINKYRQMKIADGQQFLLSHREFAKETSAKKLKLLKKIRILSEIYTAVPLICALGLSFCSLMGGKVYFWALLLSFLIFLSCF